MRIAIAIGIFCLSITACNSKQDTPPGTSANSNPGTASSPAMASNPTTSSAPAAAAKSKIDPCSLLTSDEIKAVQGQAYANVQRSDRADGDFIVAQCYYALPTTMNSVVLNVTTAKEGAGATNPRTFWENSFGKDEGNEKSGKAEKDKARAEKNKSPERGEEAEEEAAKPEKVAGLGDEAFWTASRVGGALYVLKKDQFFRISVGGAGDQDTKLKKSKTLAQDVLKRLQ